MLRIMLMMPAESRVLTEEEAMRGTQFAQLTAFVAVAENRSFTKAASHLGIKAPSLSHAIRSLEEQFGVRLLNLYE